MPKISVIMPVYNGEQYLREAIDSILAQTYTDFEFIILDDGSTDSSADIVRSYDDSRIRFVRNERNMGVAATLNRGLDLAQGEYIARMDADDISLPERFAKQVEYMDKHPNVVVLGSSIKMFGDGGETTLRKFQEDPNRAKAELVFVPCVAHPSVMINNKIIKEYQLHYDERFSGIEDFAFWWEAASVGEIMSLPEYLLRYRIHLNQVSKVDNAHTNQKFRIFVTERFRKIGVDLTDEESRIFFAYTNGKAANFSIRDDFIFTDILIRIRNRGLDCGFFEKNALNSQLQTAMIEILATGRQPTVDKWQVYRIARKSKLLSWIDGFRIARCILGGRAK